MDNLEDVRRRMRISNLEARLELHHIDVAALTREIASPLTSSQRRAEATKHRDAGLIEVFEIEAKLLEMRTLFPRLDRSRKF